MTTANDNTIKAGDRVRIHSTGRVETVIWADEAMVTTDRSGNSWYHPSKVTKWNGTAGEIAEATRYMSGRETRAFLDSLPRTAEEQAEYDETGRQMDALFARIGFDPRTA